VGSLGLHGKLLRTRVEFSLCLWPAVLREVIGGGGGCLWERLEEIFSPAYLHLLPGLEARAACLRLFCRRSCSLIAWAAPRWPAARACQTKEDHYTTNLYWDVLIPLIAGDVSHGRE